VVRLVRSKGVGAYFVTQNPLDIPDTVLGQLGNRVQHALRAFTPRDQKAVKTAAQTMRPNPGLDIEAAITELGVGEALVSLLDAKGRPMPTERAYIVPPASRIGPATDAERQSLRQGSLLAAKYEKSIDRESAYEVLAGRVAKPAGTAKDEPGQTAGQPPAADAGGGLMGGLNEVLFGSTGPRGGKRDGIVQTMAKSTLRSVARELTRGILGSLLGSKGRR
jgi:DNA helicase HerA-like ATPase